MPKSGNFLQLREQIHVQKLMHVAIVIKSCLDSGERADHASLLEEPVDFESKVWTAPLGHNNTQQGIKPRFPGAAAAMQD